MEKIKQHKEIVIVTVIILLIVGYFVVENNKATQLASVQQVTTTPPTVLLQPEKIVGQSHSLTKDAVTQGSNLNSKIQCSAYRKQIEDELFGDLTQSAIIGVLYQVFYSSSMDTCLSAKYIIYPEGGNYNGTSNESETLIINDILTGKKIWSQIYEPALEYSVAQVKLDAQIAKLF